MATSLEYSDQLINSIDIIVQSALDKASFDKTIKATIIKQDSQENGKYLVKYQDATFYAYTNNWNIQYAQNSYVYILIPQGDLSNTKIILFGENILKDEEE